MDDVEFVFFTQSAKIAEAAEVLRMQELAIKKTDRNDAASFASEALELAGQLDALAQELLRLASRWH